MARGVTRTPTRGPQEPLNQQFRSCQVRSEGIGPNSKSGYRLQQVTECTGGGHTVVGVYRRCWPIQSGSHLDHLEPNFTFGQPCDVWLMSSVLRCARF